jgi:hypothetical protein
MRVWDVDFHLHRTVRPTLVSLDISDPEHPREVSRVSFGGDESPHWASLNTTGRPVVVN